MVQLVIVLSLWTAFMAVFLSVFALANNDIPKEVNQITFGKRTLAVVLYVFTIVAGSITLWEGWKSAGYGGGGAIGGGGGGY